MAGCTSPQHACVQGIGFVCFISFFFLTERCVVDSKEIY